jgi:DNA invertase Pin-like site-specific DNA recombinase
MTEPASKTSANHRNPSRLGKRLCAIYTRKSSEEGLEQEFNSLDAQREACEAFVASQKHEGWQALPTQFDDGGLSGGSLERPALKRLIADIEAGLVHIVIVYKVDRLTRSLADFAKLTELLDRHNASFVSVTQQFNTSTSMGRLTLNVLLSFAQFEREVAGERIRDKIAASKRRGMWMGGHPPLGYDVLNKKLVINRAEARTLKNIFERYVRLQSVADLKRELDRDGVRSKQRLFKNGRRVGGKPLSRGALYLMLQNRLYRGQIAHKGNVHEGDHEAIVEEPLWDLVQATLKENRQDHSASRARSTSLLAGIIFDGDGARLTPTHAKKNGRRYRYYISTSLMRGDKPSTGLRIPASDLETLVIGRIAQQLNNVGWVTDCFGHDLTSGQIKSLMNGAKDLARSLVDPTKATTVDQRACLTAILDCAKVSEQRIELTLNLGGVFVRLGHLAGLNQQCNPEYKTETIHMEARLLRCGQQVKLILGEIETQRAVDQRLLSPIINARSWFHMLQKGEVAGIADIAKHACVSAPHVSRTISLAFLAPDILEMILEGRQPVTLTPEKLKRACPLPADWVEQRTLLLS